jgi:hypothetical protein
MQSQSQRRRPVERRDRRRAGRRIGPIPITPLGVLFVVAILGSFAYAAFVLTVRDTSSIPMLTSGAVVLGLVFTALAIAGAISMRSASLRRRDARAILLAIGGGIAAMIAAGCFAGAVVRALVGT